MASAVGTRAMRLSAGAVAIALLLAGTGIGALSYFAANKLVHPPRELSAITPDARGLDFERVAFDSLDGTPLVGWWMPAAPAPTMDACGGGRAPSAGACGTVVFLHGYGASKAQALAVAPFLVANHFNVFTFDFRSHGESGGSYTTVGVLEARDVRAAFAHVAARDDVDDDRIALFGWSMGAAAALNAGADLPQVRAFVADSSFASLSNILARHLGAFTGLPRFPFVPLILLFATNMAGEDPGANEPARQVALLGRPLLVIQGAEDAIAHPENDGGRLANAAGASAKFWLVPGAGHVDARRTSPDEYERHVVSFLHEAFA